MKLLFDRRTRPLRLALFAALLATISWLALAPAPPDSLSSGWDKANHFAAFASLMVAGRLCWPLHSQSLFALLLAYGGLIELLQRVIPGRSCEWGDLLADAVGLAAGWLASALIARLRPAA